MGEGVDDAEDEGEVTGEEDNRGEEEDTRVEIR